MATLKGGDRLRETLQRMVGAISTGRAVKVGFLSGATYPDGKPVAMIAAFNEFGTGTSPPRPFFRNMIREKKAEWGPAIGKLLVANNYDGILTLEQTGAAVAGQLRKSIVDLVDPPLAPSTIRRKGFDKPLVWTGHMLNSIDHEVIGG